MNPLPYHGTPIAATPSNWSLQISLQYHFLELEDMGGEKYQSKCHSLWWFSSCYLWWASSSPIMLSLFTQTLGAYENHPVILFLSLILFGCQSTNHVEKDTAENMKVAVALMNACKPESAADSYRKMLVSKPKWPQLLLLMAPQPIKPVSWSAPPHYLKRGIELNQSNAIYRELGRSWLV